MINLIILFTFKRELENELMVSFINPRTCKIVVCPAFTEVFRLLFVLKQSSNIFLQNSATLSAAGLCVFSFTKELVLTIAITAC